MKPTGENKHSQYLISWLTIRLALAEYHLDLVKRDGRNVVGLVEDLLAVDISEIDKCS